MTAIAGKLSLYCVLFCLVLPALVATSSSRGSPVTLRSRPSSRSRSSDSPRSPRVFSKWAQFFRVARRNNSEKIAFPEDFNNDECLTLLEHLRAQPKDLKLYNEHMCKSIDGAVLKTLVSVVAAHNAPDYAKSRLLGKKCIVNIPIETWSILSSFHAQTLGLHIASIPKTALPYLNWQTFRDMAFAYMVSQIQNPQDYNGWCRHLPKKFSRAIWTDNLWHILSPECVADIHDPDAQIAAIKLIVEKSENDLKRPEISRPDLLELGLRLIRIQAIKRTLSHRVCKTNRNVLDYLTKKKNSMITRLIEIYEINTERLEIPHKTLNLATRCGNMMSIINYCAANGGDKHASAATQEFLSIFGDLDPHSAFTWEAVSKLAVKNPSLEAIQLISRLVASDSESRLPMDTLIQEALHNSSSTILKTVIDSTRSNKLLNCIKETLHRGKREFGHLTVTALLQRIKDVKQQSLSNSRSTS